MIVPVLIGVGAAVLLAWLIRRLDRRFYGPGVWPNPPSEPALSQREPQ